MPSSECNCSMLNTKCKSGIGGTGYWVGDNNSISWIANCAQLNFYGFQLESTNKTTSGQDLFLLRGEGNAVEELSSAQQTSTASGQGRVVQDRVTSTVLQVDGFAVVLLQRDRVIRTGLVWSGQYYYYFNVVPGNEPGHPSA